MGKVSAEFAIIGAGPAGSHLASRLAASGRDCLLFDPKGAWEKPCGGGVPTRAIREFSFLLENSDYPHKLVDRITIISPVGRKVSLKLDRPFAIYSRKVLNGLVLDRALEAGAEFVHSGVTSFERGAAAGLSRQATGASGAQNFSSAPTALRASHAAD